MADDSMWIERAQSCEAKLGTIQKGNDRLKEKIRYIMDTFGAREKTDGSFEIDYQKFVDMLKMERALEVRSIIDETYKIRGEPGEKPTITMDIPALGETSPIGDTAPRVDDIMAVASQRAADPPPIDDPVLTLLKDLCDRMAYMEARLPE